MRNSFASLQQMAAIKKLSALCRAYDDSNEELEISVPVCLNKCDGGEDIFPHNEWRLVMRSDEIEPA